MIRLFAKKNVDSGIVKILHSVAGDRHRQIFHIIIIYKRARRQNVQSPIEFIHLITLSCHFRQNNPQQQPGG